MAPAIRFSAPRWNARQVRMVFYLLVLVAVAAWRFLPRPWHPTRVMETSHHHIASTATRQQTDDTAHALELLYAAYSNRLGTVEGFSRDHPKLKVKLFKDRRELRWVNPGLGWAEAFYRALDLVRLGGTLDAFEKLVGPVDEVQREWHVYVRHLKAALASGNFEPSTFGNPPTNHVRSAQR